MKRHFFVIFLIAAVFVACDSDKSPQLTDIVSGEIDMLPVTEFVLNEPSGSDNPLIVTLTWSQTDFYLDGKKFPVGAVKYLVEADLVGNDFENPITFASSENENPLAANLYVNDINNILLTNFQAMAGQHLDLELRLRTNYGENGEENYVVSKFPLTLTFVPFRPENELIPAYLIGDMNSWDLDDRAFLMYREDNKPQNHVHTYTGKFGANTHFKFCSEIALGSANKMFGKGENGTLVIGGEDFVIESEGYYTLTINDKAMTYSVVPFDVTSTAEYPVMSFVGAFCDWGSNGQDPEMSNFTVRTNGGGSITDPHNWYLEINLENIEYGVKFRANHDWNTRWCPIRPADNPYGVAEFSPAADPNIDISAQGLGQYEVRFNDLTRHYFVKKVD
ncbi:MAG: SusF/SusE family outer membrane protein [Bacteroidales bacterium]|jgi:hypothetical protein|nr:SusF/SusE family outer membrane protein [Bacteroidales bacterium]